MQYTTNPNFIQTFGPVSSADVSLTESSAQRSQQDEHLTERDRTNPVRVLRDRLGMTAAEFAKACGHTTKQVNDAEQGRYPCLIFDALAPLRALGVSDDERRALVLAYADWRDRHILGIIHKEPLPPPRNASDRLILEALEAGTRGEKALMAATGLKARCIRSYMKFGSTVNGCRHCHEARTAPDGFVP